MRRTSVLALLLVACSDPVEVASGHLVTVYEEVATCTEAAAGLVLDVDLGTTLYQLEECVGAFACYPVDPGDGRVGRDLQSGALYVYCVESTSTEVRVRWLHLSE